MKSRSDAIAALADITFASLIFNWRIAAALDDANEISLTCAAALIKFRRKLNSIFNFTFKMSAVQLKFDLTRGLRWVVLIQNSNE